MKDLEEIEEKNTQQSQAKLNFKKGNKVKISSVGPSYTTYESMAKYLKLEGFQNGRRPCTNLEGVVVGSAFHPSGFGEVVGIQAEDGYSYLIGSHGLSITHRIDDIELSLWRSEFPHLKSYIKMLLKKNNG